MKYNPLGEPELQIGHGVRYLPEALARKHEKGSTFSTVGSIDRIDPGAPPPGEPFKPVGGKFDARVPFHWWK